MLTSTANQGRNESQAADVLIPLIRAAATIGFAVAPCSLGFVIIAVSEQLIRSIMVGDDPEMLMSELQNEFPNDVLAITDRDNELVAQVVEAIDGAEPAALQPQVCRAAEFQRRVRAALKNVPADATVRLTATH
jgi:AraC family transcriptional regulator, regulatory protein of adaptative response / methylated-DNA-[protein]-cysteine methyltransferase